MDQQQLMQRIFTKVVNHLLTQGAPSRGPLASERAWQTGGQCLYRGPDGMMCAAGCLIADEHYDVSFEGKFAGYPKVSEAIARSLDAPPQLLQYCGAGSSAYPIKLVCALQRVHDNFEPIDWPGALAGVARDYGLTFNPNLKETK